MAPNSNLPPLQVLQQPESLDKVLAEDKAALREDCFSCRAMGAGVMIGLGAYVYYDGQKNITLQASKVIRSGSKFGVQSRRAGITGLSISLIAMGLYRFVN